MAAVARDRPTQRPSQRRSRTSRGALAWYLSNVPWAVPGFSIPAQRGALHRLHGHPVRVRSLRFWVRARR